MEIVKKKKKVKRLVIEISHKTIIFTLVLLFSLWFVFQIRDILFGLFIALILTGALNPTVSRLEKKGFPRWLSGLLLYAVLILALGGCLAIVVPSMINQTGELVKAFPDLTGSLEFLPFSGDLFPSQLSGIGAFSGKLFNFTISIFSNALSVVMILLISFYLLLEHHNLDKYLLEFFGRSVQEKGQGVVRKLEKILGNWVRAQLLLMLFVALLSYLGYSLLGLKFALPLAVIAGLLEIIPGLGPYLGAIPAVLIGLFTSPLVALAVAAWAFIVQQVENSYLVPKVMAQVVGVNPVISLVTIIVGAKLAGVGGALLAIPTYLTIRILLQELVFKK